MGDSRVKVGEMTLEDFPAVAAWHQARGTLGQQPNIALPYESWCAFRGEQPREEFLGRVVFIDDEGAWLLDENGNKER